MRKPRHRPAMLARVFGEAGQPGRSSCPGRAGRLTQAQQAGQPAQPPSERSRPASSTAPYLALSAADEIREAASVVCATQTSRRTSATRWSASARRARRAEDRLLKAVQNFRQQLDRMG